MSLGPKEILEVRIQVLRMKTQQLAHGAGGQNYKDIKESLAFTENEPWAMDSSELNNLKDSPQIGMIQPEVECR